jgi:hypothetical protein
MCDRPAGAAGTPRAPRRHSVLRESSYRGGIFQQLGWDTNRIRPTSTDVDAANSGFFARASSYPCVRSMPRPALEVAKRFQRI